MFVKPGKVLTSAVRTLFSSAKSLHRAIPRLHPNTLKASKDICWISFVTRSSGQFSTGSQRPRQASQICCCIIVSHRAYKELLATPNLDALASRYPIPEHSTSRLGY